MENDKAYWNTLTQIKGVSYYLIEYQAHCERYDRWLKYAPVVLSVLGIIIWILSQKLQMVGGILITGSYLFDVVRDKIIVYAERARRLSRLNLEISDLAIRAERDWISIYEGDYSGREVYQKRLSLSSEMANISNVHFPDYILPQKEDLAKTAWARTRSYFQSNFPS